MIIFFQFIILLIILLCVGFITLLERKILGLSQTRLGVNKTWFIGIVQPLLDALKLLSKEFFSPFNRYFNLFLISPCLLFCFSFLLWVIFNNFLQNSYLLNILILLIILSLNTFPLILVGWSSNRKYPVISVLRIIAQTISFEICFSIYIFLLQFNFINLEYKLSLLFFPFLIIWIFLLLVETIRCPFDLGEAERELVSGLNTEFISFTFVLLFLSEYSSIIVFRFLTSIIFFNFSYFFFCLICFIFLILRSTLVRVKLDQIMSILWFNLLPISILVVTFLSF